MPSHAELVAIYCPFYADSVFRHRIEGLPAPLLVVNDVPRGPLEVDGDVECHDFGRWVPGVQEVEYLLAPLSEKYYGSMASGGVLRFDYIDFRTNAAQRDGIPFIAQSVSSDTSQVVLRVDGLYRMQEDRLQILVTRVFLNSLFQDIEIRALRFELRPPPRGVLPTAPGAVTQLLQPRTLVPPATLTDTIAIQLPWGYDPR